MTAAVADLARDVRGVLVDVLTRRGFRLVVVEDGIEALDLVRTWKPRILFVNPYLPGLMGTDLIAKLREEGGAPETIILVGAIHNARRYRRRPESLYGADDYVDDGAAEEAILRKLEYHLKVPLQMDQRGPSGDPESLRLARSVFTDLLVYHPQKMSGLRTLADFKVAFQKEIGEARKYLEDRKPGSSGVLDDVARRFLEETRAREAGP